MFDFRIGVSALVISTLTASTGTLHSGAMGSGPEASFSTVELDLDNDCGECDDGWSPAMCLEAVGQVPCHDWVYEVDRDHGGGSCHEHVEYESSNLFFAEDNCYGHEWCGDPNCNPREEDQALITALDDLATTTTLEEANAVMEAFSSVPGVWLEFNLERAAVQVISQGCRPAPGGHVLEHIPLSEAMAQVWERAFSINQ